jgi:D-hexose-6-phosphate mutarotase
MPVASELAVLLSSIVVAGFLLTAPSCLTPQVFGTAPDKPAVAKLPQHGFARNTRWEFLSKSTSEGTGGGVKLDFALSSDGLDEAVRALWPHAFSLLYSVTLEPKSLTTSLVITNQGAEPFEFQTLLHTYFRVKVRLDIHCLTPRSGRPYANNLT